MAPAIPAQQAGFDPATCPHDDHPPSCTICASTWTLVLVCPAGQRIWSANDGRPHWTKVLRRRRLWQILAAAEVQKAGVPYLHRATVQVTIHLERWAQADAHNYPGGPALKGALDGLLPGEKWKPPRPGYRGVVADDQGEFLAMPAMPTLAPAAGLRSTQTRFEELGPPRIVLVIRPGVGVVA
jgi:hypothetical protein